MALLTAGLVWFLKSAYEKHKSEELALAKFEREFANNLTTLKDNFEFVDEWIESLKQNHRYSFHLEGYIINTEDTHKLSNLRLINQILNTNYKLKRTALDIENIYREYVDKLLRIDIIRDDEIKKRSFEQYNTDIASALEDIKQNYEPIRNDSITAVALIRSAHKVRFHSLFGYLSLIFIDVFPRVTEKSIKKKIAILNKNIAEKNILASSQRTKEK